MKVPPSLLPEERWGGGSPCQDSPGSRSPRVGPFLQGPLIHQLLCQAGTRQGPEPLAVMVLGRSIIKATLPYRWLSTSLDWHTTRPQRPNSTSLHPTPVSQSIRSPRRAHWWAVNQSLSPTLAFNPEMDMRG